MKIRSNKLTRNESGIIHHLALFVILGLVLAGVGFAGWRVWSGRDDANASSYRWSQISVAQGVTMGYCKTRLDAGLYTIRMLYSNKGTKSWGNTSFTVYDGISSKSYRLPYIGLVKPGKTVIVSGSYKFSSFPNKHPEASKPIGDC